MTDILPPGGVYHTLAPRYLHNPDDIIHIAAAPSWIYLTPLIG